MRWRNLLSLAVCLAWLGSMWASVDAQRAGLQRAGPARRHSAPSGKRGSRRREAFERGGAHEGSFVPWWKQVRVEAFGWTPRSKQATSATGNYVLEQSGSSWFTTIPDSSTGTDLTLN